MDLQYWNNGIPVLEDDSANMKALKYFLDGEPYTIIEVSGAPPPPPTYRRRVIIGSYLLSLLNICKNCLS